VGTYGDPTPAPAWSIEFALIHPVQVPAVEAFASIEEPMSGLLVYEALGRTSPVGALACRRLAEVGVTVERRVRPGRGATSNSLRRQHERR
jgi:hypothetical protein